MKKLLIIISVFMVFSACSKLEDLNKNTKDFTTVPGESLFNGANRALINQLFTCNVNQNNNLLYMQHWAETTYPDESRYDMFTRPIPANHNNVMYRPVLANYAEAAKVLKATPIAGTTVTQQQRDNQLAIIEIMSVFAWSNIVETFGDMPYTEALDYTKPTPKYDDAMTIYKDLLTRMNAALAKMTPTAASMPATYDNIFQGSTTKWISFANTIKLRMGLMIADADPVLGKATVESAAPKAFKAGEKAAHSYLAAAPNQNPLYTELVVSGRSDFVVTSILINAMDKTKTSDILQVTVTDPRLAIYCTQVITATDTTFKGGTQGNPNSYPSFSHVNPALVTASGAVVIMDYAEAEFLLAEAVERGFAVGGTAEEHYKNAITASITSWGATAAQAAAYIAQPSVAYTTATGDWKQKIGTQAWIAYWFRGFSAWNSFRRLDYPKLLAPPLHYEGIDKVPVRLTYPVSEQTLNGANYQAVVAKVGGDTPLIKLFWDKF